MPKSIARLETALAARYITLLCKHFRHKIPVEVEEGRGHADFPWGVCDMTAEGGDLVMRCGADDAEALARVQSVLEQHLVRFAWREKPALPLAWRAID